MKEPTFFADPDRLAEAIIAQVGKTIVLGLISTKTQTLEDKSALRRRIDAAAHHVPLDALAVSPQCGFASVETGNPMAPAMQEAKLRLAVELAQETWGSA